MSLLTYEVYYHSDTAEGDTQKEVNHLEESNQIICGSILIVVLTFHFNYKHLWKLNTPCTVLMLNKCYRCSEVQFWSFWSFLGPPVLHLLPRLPAGPGAGQVQGALIPPQQPAHSNPCWPPDTGFWPLRQPRPPGPHHHVQWQGKRQDPEETGGTSTEAL